MEVMLRISTLSLRRAVTGSKVTNKSVTTVELPSNPMLWAVDHHRVGFDHFVKGVIEPSPRNTPVGQLGELLPVSRGHLLYDMSHKLCVLSEIVQPESIWRAVTVVAEELLRIGD